MLPAVGESPWCDGLWAWLVAAIAGAGGGWVLANGVRRLMDPLPGDALRRRSVILAAAAAAAGLWWWEVHLHALLPAALAPSDCTVATLRFAGHLILGGFLGAATWVDLRHRVIPDAMTVPGVLTGLAWNTLFPFTLLPIPREVTRSFAPPTLESDLLGSCGGLAANGLPAWIGPAPALGGLALAGSVFAAWWWVGMPPAAPTDAAGQSSRPAWRRSHWLVAAGGAAGMLAAWLMGGDHWHGLVTALTGLAVAAGMIWTTRTGASWALGREAMGFGDVTLMAMVGSWIGWQACLLVCVLGVFIGLVHGVGQLLRHSESELPFGPSLCLATVIVIVGWRPLWAAAGPQFGRPLELATVVALVIGLTAVTLWAWQRLRGDSPDAENT
jgi:leader peptidase (prepilin peptidase) / N-methyltransferase